MDLAQRDQIPGRSLASVKDVMDDRTMANGKRSIYLYGQCGEDMNTRYQGGDGFTQGPLCNEVRHDAELCVCGGSRCFKTQGDDHLKATESLRRAPKEYT